MRPGLGQCTAQVSKGLAEESPPVTMTRQTQTERRTERGAQTRAQKESRRTKHRARSAQKEAPRENVTERSTKKEPRSKMHADDREEANTERESQNEAQSKKMTVRRPTQTKAHAKKCTETSIQTQVYPAVVLLEPLGMQLAILAVHSGNLSPLLHSFDLLQAWLCFLVAHFFEHTQVLSCICSHAGAWRANLLCVHLIFCSILVLNSSHGLYSCALCCCDHAVWL